MVATPHPLGTRHTFMSFSPLFIGAMVATHHLCYYSFTRRRLSVPFSSGQWLLLDVVGFELTFIGDFQSPFHRGNGCYIAGESSIVRTQVQLSVPFSSGQWLLLCNPSQEARCASDTFSPLFIGAMVATEYGNG